MRDAQQTNFTEAASSELIGREAMEIDSNYTLLERMHLSKKAMRKIFVAFVLYAIAITVMGLFV